ncbi:FUSC family protein [Chitinibacter tainanensis]|uniref:FUSC family protein n=1 Tax=Chitinibacter tainanensis TaxID=230667 RepID=UPI0004064525|nr:FUSC family protein [Chitinibacter tainanensis]
MPTLLQLLRPSPGRLEYALRTALICLLTTLAVVYFATPEPALTVYLVFFLSKTDRVSSIIQSLAIVVLATLLIGVVLLMARPLIDEPMLRVASMVGFSILLLFCTSASKLRPVGAIIALIMVYALDLLGQAPSGEIVTRALLYAWLFAAIPAASCILINLLLGPVPRRLAEQALAHRLELAASQLSAPPNAAPAHAWTQILAEGTTQIGQWLKLAKLEKTAPANELAALDHATQTITPLLLLLKVAAQEPDFPASARQQLAQALNTIASSFRAGEYPARPNLAAHLPGDGDSKYAQTLWQQMSACLLGLTIPPTAAVPASPAANREASGFFVADAFSNPMHLRYALKTTAAAMACYLIYTALNWPGIHTSLITCYIVALATTAETQEKLRLRIFGCFVGALAGVLALVWLIPTFTSITPLLILVFIGAALSAWVVGGSAQIAYAGLQIAFAFFICVIQGDSASFDLVGARDRLLGMLLGFLMISLVFTYLWPVSIAPRIDSGLARLLQGLGEMGRADNHAELQRQASTLSAALSTVERDLGLIRFEPAAIRPSAAWLAQQQQTAQHISRLIGPLLLCLLAASTQPPAARTAIAQRLARLNPSAAGAQPHGTWPPSPSSEPSLDPHLESCLQDLERILALQATTSPEEPDHA